MAELGSKPHFGQENPWVRTDEGGVVGPHVGEMTIKGGGVVLDVDTQPGELPYVVPMPAQGLLESSKRPAHPVE